MRHSALRWEKEDRPSELFSSASEIEKTFVVFQEKFGLSFFFRETRPYVRIKKEKCQVFQDCDPLLREITTSTFVLERKTINSSMRNKQSALFREERPSAHVWEIWLSALLWEIGNIRHSALRWENKTLSTLLRDSQSASVKRKQNISFCKREDMQGFQEKYYIKVF